MSKKTKRAVGYLSTHAVLMAISYSAAEHCGSAANPIAQIWLAVAASFFLVVGVVCFLEAIRAAVKGGNDD